jgi:DNA-binding transcriptional MocR family regulator
LARAILRGTKFRADPAGFHLWLSLPAPWTRSAFVGHMRTSGIGVVASDAFTTGTSSPEAVRVCLGGPADRPQVREALEFMAHALEGSPSMASSYL